MLETDLMKLNSSLFDEEDKTNIANNCIEELKI